MVRFGTVRRGPVSDCLFLGRYKVWLGCGEVRCGTVRRGTVRLGTVSNCLRAGKENDEKFK